MEETQPLKPEPARFANHISDTFHVWGSSPSMWTVKPKEECPEGKIAVGKDGKWLDRDERPRWGKYPVNDPRRPDWGLLAQVLQRPLEVPADAPTARLALKQALIDTIARDGGRSLVAACASKALGGFSQTIGSTKEAVDIISQRLLHIRPDGKAPLVKRLKDPVNRGSSTFPLHYWEPQAGGVGAYVGVTVRNIISDVVEERTAEPKLASLDAQREKGLEITTDGTYVRKSSGEHRERVADGESRAIAETERKAARLSAMARDLGLSRTARDPSRASLARLDAYVAEIEPEVVSTLAKLAPTDERGRVASAETLDEALSRAPRLAELIRSHKRVTDLGLTNISLPKFLTTDPAQRRKVAEIAKSWDRSARALPEEIQSVSRPDLPFLKHVARVDETIPAPRSIAGAAAQVKAMLGSPLVMQLVTGEAKSHALQQFLLHRAEQVDFRTTSMNAFLREQMNEWLSDPELQTHIEAELKSGKMQVLQPIDPRLTASTQVKPRLSAVAFKSEMARAASETDRYLRENPEAPRPVETEQLDVWVRKQMLPAETREGIYRVSVAAKVSHNDLFAVCSSGRLGELAKTQDAEEAQQIVAAFENYRGRVTELELSYRALERKGDVTETWDSIRGEISRNPNALRRAEKLIDSARKEGRLIEQQSYLELSETQDPTSESPTRQPLGDAEKSRKPEPVSEIEKLPVTPTTHEAVRPHVEEPVAGTTIEKSPVSDRAEPPRPPLPPTATSGNAEESPDRGPRTDRERHRWQDLPRLHPDSVSLAETVLKEETKRFDARVDYAFDLEKRASTQSWYAALSAEQRAVAREAFMEAGRYRGVGIVGRPEALYNAYSRDIESGKIDRTDVQRKNSLGPLWALQGNAQVARGIGNESLARAYDHVAVRSAAGIGKLDQLAPETIAEQMAVRDRTGVTPLHIAAEAGNLRQLPKQLVSPSALMIQSENGDTVAHVAARSVSGWDQVPREAQAAEVFTVRNRAGETPLHVAATWGSLRQIPREYLTTESLSSKTVEGSTVLHVAASSRTLDQLPTKVALSPENMAREDGAGRTVGELAIEAEAASREGVLTQWEARQQRLAAVTAEFDEPRVQDPEVMPQIVR